MFSFYSVYLILMQTQKTSRCFIKRLMGFSLLLFSFSLTTQSTDTWLLLHLPPSTLIGSTVFTSNVFLLHPPPTMKPTGLLEASQELDPLVDTSSCSSSVFGPSTTGAAWTFQQETATSSIICSSPAVDVGAESVLQPLLDVFQTWKMIFFL